MRFTQKRCKSRARLTLLAVTLALSACRPVTPYHVSDRAESREEAYVKVDTIAALPVGQVFQFRLRGNSEQCVVPFLEQLNTRQCDGKAHWRLLHKTSGNSGVVRIQHTVAPLCIAVNGDRIKFDVAGQLQGEGGCQETRFDLRFDGALNDAQGKQLVYLPSPTSPGQQQSMEIWIPVQSFEPSPIVGAWNLDVNYGPAFLLPKRIKEQVIYQSDGWSVGKRRWLSGIFVYSDIEGTRIKGLKTVYSDGENTTANNLGACDGNITEAQCRLLDFVEIGNPPLEKLTPQELAEKYNFITAVSVLHNGDYIVGLKFSGNKMPEKTVVIPNIEPSKLIETPIKFAFDREDQVVTGFYGSFGQLDQSTSSAYLKDLGIIAGRYETYARAWDNEVAVSQSGERYLIRKSEKPVDAFGPTAMPSNAEQGYFETVAPTDAANRHWISSFELYAGGGRNELVSNGPANLAFFETNDVVGLKVHYSLTDAGGSASAHELQIGYAQSTKRPSPVVELDEYEYISKVEYRPLVKEYQETISQSSTSRANYSFVPTAGIAALRFTLSNIKDANQRVVTWDTSDPDYQNPSVARTTSPSASARARMADWVDLGSDPERAVVGFYGVANNTLNPTYNQEKRYVPAIKTLGVISTTVGCAFRYKVFTENLEAIRAFAKVALDDRGDEVRARCVPPASNNNQ